MLDDPGSVLRTLTVSSLLSQRLDADQCDAFFGLNNKTEKFRGSDFWGHFNGKLNKSFLFIKAFDRRTRVLMESLMERLFRETYELDEIPDPHRGSPYPLRPPELLSHSSPLAEPAHGSDPDWFEWDIYAWLWGTPHDYSSGLLEAPALSLITEASHDSDLHTPQELQGPTNHDANNPNRGIRSITSGVFAETCV